MNKNQKGFSTPELLLVVIIIALLSFTGWYVWSRNRSTGTASLESAPEQSQDNENAEEKKPWVKGENTYFDIALPAGWDEVEPDFGVTNKAEFKYANSGGANFQVVVDADGFGWDGCQYGDGKLFVLVSSEETHKNNSYLFSIRDEARETKQAFNEIADAIETIRLK